MIVPRFMRFYGYSASEVIAENAVTFFALVNSMFQIQADELLDYATVNALPHIESKDAERVLKSLEKTSKGLSGLIDEAKVIQNVVRK